MTDLDFQYEALSSVMRNSVRVAIKMLELYPDEIIEMALDRYEQNAEDMGIGIWGKSPDELTTDAKEEAADLLNYISTRMLIRLAHHTDEYIKGDEHGAEATLHALRSALDIEERIEETTDQG